MTLATYAGSLGVSYDLIGMIIGSYGLSQILLRIPLGVWSDALGRRKIFVIAGAVLAMVSALGMWYSPNPWWLLLFRTMSGVSAATWVIHTVLFSSYYPSHEAPKAIGFINSVLSVG